MNKLLEIKDKAVKFCGEYEHFILPVVRFAVAFIAFITIDLNIGYMAKISSMLVALLLALVCALLPVNAILWIASIMILLDMYALSIEVFAITFVLFLVLYFVYFRFAPKDGMLVILTPICFQLHIPSVMPVAAGLLRRAYSVVAIICGTLLYYFLDGIRQNASALAEVVDKKGQSTTKLNVTMGQLLDNKEMFIVMAIFVITTLVVYQVRRLKINNSWTVATIAGGLVQLVALVVAYLVLGYVCECGGSIYYSMWLHLLFNLWGTLSGFFPDPGNSVVICVIVIAVTIVSLVVGFVLFNKGRRKLPINSTGI